MGYIKKRERKKVREKKEKVGGKSEEEMSGQAATE
jgi:hypothetical protein